MPTNTATEPKARAPAPKPSVKVTAPPARNPKPEPRKSNPICKREKCKVQIPDIAMDNNDPFCSSSCARKFFGVEEEDDEKQEERDG